MKSKFLITSVLASVFSVTVFAFQGIGGTGGGFECRVSAKPELNQGHCRNYSEGNDLCYPDGDGPACWKSQYYP